LLAQCHVLPQLLAAWLCTIRQHNPTRCKKTQKNVARSPKITEFLLKKGLFFGSFFENSSKIHAFFRLQSISPDRS